MSNPDYTQLDLFSNTDPRPLPLIIADKWVFPLQHYEPSAQIGYRFSVQDWLRGLTQSSNTSRLWADLKNANEVYGSIVHLPYSTRGGTFQMDFVSDQDLYRIAQDLRQLKKRTALAKANEEIMEYLAKAGAFAEGCIL